MENDAVFNGVKILPSDDSDHRQKRQALLSPAAREGLQRTWDRLIGLVVPFILVVIWETVAQLNWIKPVFLPAPSVVFKTFINLLTNDQFLGDIWVSIYTVFRGFSWGLGLGLLFGTSAGMSRTVDRLFGPLLNAVRQVPPIAWLPLIVLWVGIGDFGKLVVLAKAVFFPVFLNTVQGIRSVSKEYVEVARVYEFSRFQLIRRVIFPAALPTIFAGVRLGAGLAWAYIVFAEMLAGRKGLGYILTRGQDLLQTDEVFVVIVVIGFIGYLIDYLLRSTEGRLITWKKSFVN
jgi:sulfonate transport system permease protein